MKNYSVCKTKFNNNYYANHKKRYYIFLPPILIYFMENEKNIDSKSLPTNLIIGNFKYESKEISHYYRKFIFLKKHGLLSVMNKPEEMTGYLHPNNIKWQLANLTSLVFEVTDRCNLKCKYCAYGEFYSDKDDRSNKYMTFEMAKSIIDYLVPLWGSELNHSIRRNVTFGFYGGEPLLNFRLIKRIVTYLETVAPSSINCNFNMTTNGMLLNKYMDYLMEKKFHLLISIDGGEENHSYRVTQNGSNSFIQVYKNIRIFKEKYPEYFKKKVDFNSVLHNKNSLQDIFSFINGEFGKIPSISQLNSTGINPDKIKEYYKIYKNTKEDLQQSEHYDKLSSKLQASDPDFKQAIQFVQRFSGNVYKKYSELLTEGTKNVKVLPTGTCIPFERKMFITVNGKILPCERIGQQNYLGRIINNIVEIDFEYIAKRYNNYYNKMKKQCNSCYTSLDCFQCLFNLEKLEENPVCYGFSNQTRFNEFISNHISFLEKKPTTYKESMNIVSE